MKLQWNDPVDQEKLGRNWKEAQSVSFSVPLVSAAQQLLHFLAQVDRHRCLYAGPAVSRAIQRYEFCWLPLLAGFPDHQLQPPLDCAWIWHVHRLNPIVYARDCNLHFGRLLDAPPHAHDATKRDEALENTKALWRERFPDESFELDLAHFEYDVQWTPPSHEIKMRRIKYDLENAVARQSTFFYQVSRPYMKERSFLTMGEHRYKAFLHLFKLTECRVFLVPTYDIDLIWHAHQLNPKAYSEDLMLILGKVLEHDDTDTDRGSGQKLDEGFCRTSEEWLRYYGRVYEQAGAMYRGETACSANPVSEAPAVGTPLNFVPVAPREIMQVTITVLRARNLPEKGGTVRVCLQLQKKCSTFRLMTPSVSFTSEAAWIHTWRFQAETSTEGFYLELQRKHSSRFVEKLKGSSGLGHTSLSWKFLLSTTTLSFTDWVSLTPSQTDGPSLYVSVSVTPPYPGPQMFRIINSIPTDDYGRMGMGSFFDRRGCWLTRTVLDHANRQVFLVRSRYSDGHTRTPEAEKCIYIHEGGWEYRNSHTTKGTAPAAISASANQVVTGKESKDILSTQRTWDFFQKSSHLVVRASKEDPKWNLRPDLELGGNLKHQVDLVCGRKLDYEVKGASEDDEGGFVTVIRYNLADSSMGKATALFNWRTGAMEVSPEESAVLIVLLSSIISISVMEMEGVKVKFRKQQKPPSRSVETFDEWGGVEVDIPDGDIGGDIPECPSDSITPFQCWWEMPPTEWSCTFYAPDNPLFGASGCGAAGACGAGACGGTACGGAGCGGAAGGGCGGGAGGGGCGGGGGGGGGGGCGGGGASSTS